MSRIEQKRRELFEAFLDEMKGKLVSGPYHDPASNAGWIAWNAALDAVVIELPDSWKHSNPQSYEIDCRAAIETTGLGLKVK